MKLDIIAGCAMLKACGNPVRADAGPEAEMKAVCGEQPMPENPVQATSN